VNEQFKSKHTNKGEPTFNLLRSAMQKRKDDFDSNLGIMQHWHYDDFERSKKDQTASTLHHMQWLPMLHKLREFGYLSQRTVAQKAKELESFSELDKNRVELPLLSMTIRGLISQICPEEKPELFGFVFEKP